MHITAVINTILIVSIVLIISNSFKVPSLALLDATYIIIIIVVALPGGGVEPFAAPPAAVTRDDVQLKKQHPAFQDPDHDSSEAAGAAEPSQSKNYFV